jgi:hypothetical protein
MIDRIHWISREPFLGILFRLTRLIYGYKDIPTVDIRRRGSQGQKSGRETTDDPRALTFERIHG